MFISTLHNEAKKFDILFSEQQLKQFDVFYNMLIEFNKKVNLTTITEPKDFAVKHVIDSVSLWNDEKFSNVKTIIDVGTGAGFPGIPLKIYKPNLQILLLDSLNKRIIFLQNVIDELKLENISCMHSRAEDAAHNPKLRESFDLAVSRAVAKLNVLSEYCLPFVKINGFFVAQKGSNIFDEVNEAGKIIKMLGGNNKFETTNFKLPNGDERNIIYIKKFASTPKKFPRKAGLIEKKPLI